MTEKKCIHCNFTGSSDLLLLSDIKKANELISPFDEIFESAIIEYKKGKILKSEMNLRFGNKFEYNN